IPQCRLMIVLIGPQWLAGNTKSNPRIFDPDDTVRLEIETALRAGVPILCALLEGAVKPKRTALPKSVRALCDCQFVEIRSDRDFRKEFSGLSNLCTEVAATPDPSFRFLHLPDLDVDSRITVRVLAAMGLQLQEAIARTMDDRNSLIVELNRD